jgi:DNA repair protein RecO (recombination protein O)
MFVHYRSRALILKKTDRGEADQLFTVYAKDFGKLEVLGKGIRKIKSKLRASIELFYLSEIEFIQGKAYKTLTDAVLVEKFENIRKDLNKLKIVHQVSQVSDKLITGQEKDEKIWQLLIEVFQKLDNPKFKILNLQLVFYYFLWNLLSILGYRPSLYRCPFCQRKLKPEELYFSKKEGGVLCKDCQKRMKSGKKIKPELIKILRILIERDWKILLKLKFQEKYLENLESFSKDYLSFIFGGTK